MSYPKTNSETNTTIDLVDNQIIVRSEKTLSEPCYEVPYGVLIQSAYIPESRKNIHEFFKTL